MLVPPANFGIVEEGLYRASYIDSINYLFLETLSLKSILLLDVERPQKQFYKFLQKNKIQLYQISNKRLKVNHHHHHRHHHHHQQQDFDNVDDKSGVDYGAGNDVTNDNYEFDKSLGPVGSSVGDYDNQFADNELKDYEKSIIYIYNDTLQSSRKDNWMVIKKNLVSKIFEVLLNKNTYNLMVVDSMDMIVSILRKIQKWNYSNLISEYRLYANKNKTYQVENYLDIIQIELVLNEKDQPQQAPDFIDKYFDNINLESSNDSRSKPKEVPKAPEVNISNTQRPENQRQNSVGSYWSPDSYEYFANSPSVHRSPQDISASRRRDSRVSNLANSNTANSQDNHNSLSHTYSLQLVNSYKSLRSRGNSYDDLYRGSIASATDRTERDTSSSPQIPNNLLRMMELRKKNKRAAANTDEDTSEIITKDADGDNDKNLTSDSFQNNSNDEGKVIFNADVDKRIKHLDSNEQVRAKNQKEHKSLLSAELAHLNTSEKQKADESNSSGIDLTKLSLMKINNQMANNPPPGTSTSSDIRATVTPSTGTDTETEGTVSQTDVEAYQRVYYKPLLKEKYGDINNHIEVKLPPKEMLPGWFQLQSNMWTQEFMELNGLSRW